MCEILMSMISPIVYANSRELPLLYEREEPELAENSVELFYSVALPSIEYQIASFPFT